jgi:alpha-ketoglutarate-dependent 2,4-dichlorophenoxyacetate dioxygenase
MELVPLGPEFGVEVRGIGLIDVASSDAVYRSIRATLEEHCVLLFRGQEVTDDVQTAFSRAFGPLEQVKIGAVGAGIRTTISAVDADGVTELRVAT